MRGIGATGLTVGILMAVSGTAQAQTWTPPSESQRCPSKWGANDERGSGNHMKPATVLRALSLVKTGEVIELAFPLRPDMPFPGGRMYNLTTKRTALPAGPNRRGGNEEMVMGEMGQVGTQFDGFSHQTIDDKVYNCRTVDSIATRNGFTAFGIEKVGTLITRAVLIDVAALKGVPVLPDSYEITVADLEQALKAKNLTLQPGDAPIIHTGWGTNWTKDPAKYVRVNPGLGTAAAEWLARQDPMMVGMDVAPISVTPSPDGKLNNPAHQIFLAVNGIHLLENLKLDQLLAAGWSEFALVLQPVKMTGATGSTVAPVAIR